MKRPIVLLLVTLFAFSTIITMSAEVNEVTEPQNLFYYSITFDRLIEDPNYMEACIDAYCYGGQTGQGHALASVEYNQLMLHSDYDIGSFVTACAHAGDYQDPTNILYPDASKRRALWSVNELRWSDLDNVNGNLPE